MASHRDIHIGVHLTSWLMLIKMPESHVGAPRFEHQLHPFAFQLIQILGGSRDSAGDLIPAIYVGDLGFDSCL